MLLVKGLCSSTQVYLPLLGRVGDNSFDSALKDAALKKDTVVAFKTCNAYISAEPDYLPLIATAGMLLLEADYVPQLYLHNHSSCLKELG